VDGRHQLILFLDGQLVRHGLQVVRVVVGRVVAPAVAVLTRSPAFYESVSAEIYGKMKW
jgi:hypothetical protein